MDGIDYVKGLVQKMFLMILVLFSFRLDPDTDQEAFWDFDLETVSIGDLPAVFDYVFNITQEESDGPYFFVCHSMGCAEIAVLLSEYTEYNDLFDAVFMMAPPIFMGNRYATVLLKIKVPKMQFFQVNFRIFKAFLFDKIHKIEICSFGHQIEKVCNTELIQTLRQNFCFLLDNHHCNVVNVLLISFTVESVFGVGLPTSLKISWVTKKFERLGKKDVGLQRAKVGSVIQLRQDR